MWEIDWTVFARYDAPAPPDQTNRLRFRPVELSFADLFARLVAFDTTSQSSNLALVDFLSEVLARPAIELQRFPSANGAKATLVARVGPPVDPATRAGLVLSGHTDVVPAGEGWTSDPFTLTDAGDRLVARGACDMKGFVALAVEAAITLDPATLRHPLVLLLTYDEELGCLGAMHLVETATGRLQLPRAAIIGEPTELALVRLHKGHLKLRATFHGKSAHSGYPHLGDNAIERAAAGIAALGAVQADLAELRVAASASFPDAPAPTLNIGTIAGGVAINVVPERCSVEIGIRLLPGLEIEPLVERVRAALAPAAGPHGFALEVLSASPPMELAVDAPIHRALCELLAIPEGGAVSYATDAGWLSKLGLDCAIFGPGSITVAHQPDEFVPKADLAFVRAALARMIDRFCREVP